MQEDRDYRFLADDPGDTVPIEILRGKYRGVVFRFQTVSGREPEAEDDDAVLSFRHVILRGKQPKRDLSKEPDFHRTLGDILVAILTTRVNEKEKNAARDEDIEEFDDL